MAIVAEGSPAEPGGIINTDTLLESRRETTAHTSRKNVKCAYGTQKCGYYHGRSWLTCQTDSTITEDVAQSRVSMIPLRKTDMHAGLQHRQVISGNLNGTIANHQ